MRLGQTSAVVFLSRLSSSAIGFLATLYFAQILGAEVLGFYFLSMTLVSWLKIGGNLGVSSALIKRLSEGSEQASYVGAGVISMLGFGILVSVVILGADKIVNQYVGRPVAVYVAGLVLIGLAGSVINSVLNGQRSVHIAGLLDPARVLMRVGVQVGLVVGGIELTGLFLGQGAGWLTGIVLGLLYIKVGVAMPEKRHFRSLYDHAKYSWLGSLKARSINDVDIVILGLFVPTSLVGVYAVVWAIARFLTTFHNSVNQTLFPEISRADTTNQDKTVAKLVTDGLQYSGLFLIPGLVGGSILAERILRLYGNEFVQGTEVMGILILSVVFYGYQQQLLKSIEAIDRPDITFRINVAFVGTNILANLVLIYTVGWVGAAVASAVSTGIGLILSFIALRNHVKFRVPYLELLKQVTAALIMGVVVYAGSWFKTNYYLIDSNPATVVGLIVLGAGIYFAVLFYISTKFRTTVKQNIDLLL
jgi:O-antigen/teichoic acid export membrane protein